MACRAALARQGRHPTCGTVILSYTFICLVQVGKELDTVCRQFEPYRWCPCGVNCDVVPEQSWLQSCRLYFCKNLHCISQHDLGYPCFDDFSQHMQGYSQIKQKQMGYPNNSNCDLSKDIGYLKTSTFVPTFTSSSLFSVGKMNSWYKSGLVKLTLRILFHTKYQGNIWG